MAMFADMDVRLIGAAHRVLEEIGDSEDHTVASAAVARDTGEIFTGVSTSENRLIDG